MKEERKSRSCWGIHRGGAMWKKVVGSEGKEAKGDFASNNDHREEHQ